MGLRAMRKTVLWVLSAVLIGCNGTDSSTPKVVIDNTPIEPLMVGGTIQRLFAPEKDFSLPDNAAWRDAQEYRLALDLAPPVHQSISLRYEPARPQMPLNIRAASDGEKLYFRLRWADASNDAVNSREFFSDAAAIQFALSGGSSTSFMMGASPTPVNIWYWKAAEALPQNLAAAGFGSTTRLDQGALMVESHYRDEGEWVVVFSRSIETEGEYQANLNESDVFVSFALWQGLAKQRDGLKHISQGWVNIR